jgi:hypothetical protein
MPAQSGTPLKVTLISRSKGCPMGSSGPLMRRSDVLPFIPQFPLFTPLTIVFYQKNPSRLHRLGLRLTPPETSPSPHVFTRGSPILSFWRLLMLSYFLRSGSLGARVASLAEIGHRAHRNDRKVYPKTFYARRAMPVSCFLDWVRGTHKISTATINHRPRYPNSCEIVIGRMEY